MSPQIDASSALQDGTQNYTLLKIGVLQIVVTKLTILEIHIVKIGNKRIVNLINLNLSAVGIPIGNAPRMSNGNAILNHPLMNQSAAHGKMVVKTTLKECIAIRGNQTAVMAVVLPMLPVHHGNKEDVTKANAAGIMTWNVMNIPTVIKKKIHAAGKMVENTVKQKTSSILVSTGHSLNAVTKNLPIQKVLRIGNLLVMNMTPTSAQKSTIQKFLCAASGILKELVLVKSTTIVCNTYLNAAGLPKVKVVSIVRCVTTYLNAVTMTGTAPMTRLTTAQKDHHQDHQQVMMSPISKLPITVLKISLPNNSKNVPFVVSLPSIMIPKMPFLLKSVLNVIQITTPLEVNA